MPLSQFFYYNETPHQLSEIGQENLADNLSDRFLVIEKDDRKNVTTNMLFQATKMLFYELVKEVVE